jgi:hypothetical protein
VCGGDGASCLTRFLLWLGVGMYKGLVANTVKAVPGAAIQFASYDLIKQALGLDH